MAKARPYARKRPSKLTSITAWHDFARNRFMFLFLAGIFALGIVMYFGSGQTGSGQGGSARTARGQEAIALVNGEPVSRADFQRQWEGFGRSMGAQGASEAARMQGNILSNIMDQALQIAVAKKRGMVVSDEEIENRIEQMKESFGPKGKPLSDEELEAILERQFGLTLADAREDMRRSLLPNELQKSIASTIKVTEDDLLESYDELKMRHILIATTTSERPPKGALPDAQAKRRAEDILAKLKAGEKFEKLADEYSMDPSNKAPHMDPKTKKTVTTGKGGDLTSTYPEGWYKRGSGFVKEFEDASFALKKGETSGVVKTPFGYHIIKVDDVRRNLPKDYAKNKPELLKSLQAERAQKPVQELFDAAKKTAKIEWKDPYYKWRYDYAKQSPMFGMTPDAAGMDKDAFVKELRGYVEKNKDDGAAWMVLGQELYQQYMMSGLQLPGQKPPAGPKPDRDKLRAEVITAYENGLKQTEDRDAGFTVAQLYEESKQNDKALERLDKIRRVLKYDDKPDAKYAHKRLEQAYKRLGKADIAAEEAKVYAQMDAKEKEQQRKAAEEAKKAAEEEKKSKAAAASKGNPATGIGASSAAPLPNAAGTDKKDASSAKPDAKDSKPDASKPDASKPDSSNKESSGPKPK